MLAWEAASGALALMLLAWVLAVVAWTLELVAQSVSWALLVQVLLLLAALALLSAVGLWALR